MIEEDNNHKPFSADTLPLPHDSDQDGAADDIDVSHIYKTAPQPAGQKEIVIGPKDSLTQKPMEMDVVTRFDFDDFLPGTLGLIQIITTKISLKEKISHELLPLTGIFLFISYTVKNSLKQFCCKTDPNGYFPPLLPAADNQVVSVRHRAAR